MYKKKNKTSIDKPVESDPSDIMVDTLERFFSTKSRKRLFRASTKIKKPEKRRYVKIEKEYEHIVMAGVTIFLPLGLRPYPTQKLMMIKMLTALRDKTNALIESPTGSGKTMALLSSACGWLVKYKEERCQSRLNCLRHGQNILKNHTDETMCISDTEIDVTMTSCANESSIISIDNDASVSSKPANTTANTSSFCTHDEFDEIMSETVCNTNDFKSLMEKPDSDLEKMKRILANADTTFGNEDNKTECTCLPRVTIYYGTRTHKQIAQVVKEYARLPFGADEKLRHTILASREHSCINPAVRTSRTGGDITTQCRELLSKDGPGCTYRNEYRKFENNAPRMRDFLEQSGGDRVWDMEDLVSTLSDAHPAVCPYFTASRTLTIDADIVFCPFNYVLDPIIRDSSDVRMKNSVFILDEAHNVEDICRDAASFEFQEKELIFCLENIHEKENSLSSLIHKLSTDDAISLPIPKEIGDQRVSPEELVEKFAEYHASLTIVSKFLLSLYKWIKQWAVKVLAKIAMRSDGLITETSTWQELYDSFGKELLLLDGSEEQRILRSAWLEIVGAGGNSAINGDQSSENPIAYFRPSQSVIVCVEKFLYFMHYYSLEQNQNYYKCNITIEKTNPNNPNSFAPSTQRGFGMSQSKARAITRSTQADEWLSTRNTQFKFESIKPNFDVKLNLWCMFPSVAFADAFAESRSVILASGTLCPTETLKSELGLEFSGEMEGTQVISKERIFATVLAEGPTGRRLNATYRNIAAGSEFMMELSEVVVSTCMAVPRGVLCFLSSYNVLSNLMEAIQYRYDLNSALRSRKVVFEEPRRSSELQSTLDRYEEVIRHPERFGPDCDGALMLAVFRGKISEGIDFADDKARCVICVGIPYPNARNELVVQKKRFNDENAQKANILGGDEWYTTQAYRALNQALGRCLRHRGDWGALILVDERYIAKANPKCSDSKKISKWVRDRLLLYSNFSKFQTALGQFVARMHSQDENNFEIVKRETVKKEPTPIIAII